MFNFFKKKIINVVSSESELRGLLSILKDEKRDLELQIQEKDNQISQIEKMIETFS